MSPKLSIAAYPSQSQSSRQTVLRTRFREGKASVAGRESVVRVRGTAIACPVLRRKMSREDDDDHARIETS